MSKHYTSSDGSVVLGATFHPVDGPDSEGAVTIPAAGGFLTIDGTDYTGLSGACVLPPDQGADPGSTSVQYIGTFAFAVDPHTSDVLSGTVTGAFDLDRLFCPARFTDVVLSHPLTSPADFSQILLPPLDDDEVAMGTSSVIIKPTTA